MLPLTGWWQHSHPTCTLSWQGQGSGVAEKQKLACCSQHRRYIAQVPHTHVALVLTTKRHKCESAQSCPQRS